MEMYIDSSDFITEYTLHWEDSKWEKHIKKFSSKKRLIQRLNEILDKNVYNIKIGR